MKEYKVIASITAEANVIVEANSMQQAEQIAMDSGILDDLWDNTAEVEPKVESEEV